MPSFLLIIGAAKAGTTSLFSMLSQHPDIIPCSRKEPDFFSSYDRQFGSHSVVSRYSQLWTTSQQYSDKAWFLEASTSYSKYPGIKEIPKKIFESGINCKFLYIMRDPFERIESHWNWNQSDRNWHHDIVDPYLTHLSDYYLQLTQYSKYFSRTMFHLLTLEDLSTDPCKTLSGIANFLQIPFESFPVMTSGPRNVSKNQSTGERFLLRMDNSKSLLKLPSFVKALGKVALRKLTPPARRCKLSPRQRLLIYSRLAPGMSKLHKEYGVNTAQWGF